MPLYDGTIFHRVIPDFMIQGGDPAGTGSGNDPIPPFKNEVSSDLLFDRPGRLAYANTGQINSNSSQFFITEVATPHLNGGYTIFRTVRRGQRGAGEADRAHGQGSLDGQAISSGEDYSHQRCARYGNGCEAGGWNHGEEACCNHDPEGASEFELGTPGFAQAGQPRRLVPTWAQLLSTINFERTLMTRPTGLYATFETSEGTIVCRLFDKEAPKTVANFVELAEGKREWTHPSTRKKSKDRLYDGTIFHRVIPDFMIQGGDPQGTGTGGPGYQFEDETKGSPHKFDKPGKLAMANAGPNTNGSQFFITTVPTTWLTGKHTIFGEVVEGQDIAVKITGVPQNRQNRPNKDVVLKKVTIEKV